MKKVFLALFVVMGIAFAATAQNSKTIYIMKKGEVVYQSAVSEIDSIVFHAPVSSTVDEGVVINGVKWATRNIDKPGTFAANPEDAGMFYQWNRKIGWSATNPMINSDGGTTWDNSMPTGTTWKKANDPSPAGWRVPTLDEIKTLLAPNKVSKEWTTQNGIYGLKFTDKATDNSLFFPATGFRFAHDGNLISAGESGHVWSSEEEDMTFAYYLGFHGNDIARYYTNRMTGLTIRPVADTCSKDSVIICTQAYRSTDDLAVGCHKGFDDENNLSNPGSPVLQSLIWTVGGNPCILRFYLNFDLSNYNKTKKTQIQNTFLHLYAHPTYEGHASSTSTNRYEFFRVVSEWEETLFTWNNQPKVDETISFVTDHIPGTTNNPSRDNCVFKLNDVLLENGKLKADYNGVSCRPYQEDFDSYYRRITFATREFGNGELAPTMKVQYAIPRPIIKFTNNVFSVINNEDLKALFENVQYVWTVNGKKSTGESVHLKNTETDYLVDLQIIVTNNIGEVSFYNISGTF